MPAPRRPLRRSRSCVVTGPAASLQARSGSPHSGLPRLQAAADQPLAGAGRHEDPGVLLAVTSRRSGARGIGSLAVILPGLGDPIALLGLEPGFRRGTAALALGGEREGERRSHGRCDEELGLFHVDLSFLWL